MIILLLLIMNNQEFKKAMKEAGFKSQAAFARAINVGQMRVSRWANGVYKVDGAAEAYLKLLVGIKKLL